MPIIGNEYVLPSNTPVIANDTVSDVFDDIRDAINSGALAGEANANAAAALAAATSATTTANAASSAAAAANSAVADVKVITVATIAALQALPASKLAATTKYFVQEYDTGLGTDGGGEFKWDAASAASTNIGTIFSSNNSPTGRFLRVYKELTPQMFGVRGFYTGSSQDDKPGLQAMFDFIVAQTNVPITVRWVGDYIIQSAVVCGAANSDTAPLLTMITACNIYAGGGNFGSGTTGFMLEFTNMNRMTQIGVMRLDGNGGTTYTSRATPNGILIKSRRSKWDHLAFREFRLWAVKCNNASTGTHINHISAQHCGSVGGTTSGYALNFTARTDLDSNNNPQQRSRLTVPTGDLATLVALESWCIFNGRPHEIREVDTVGRTISVAPWLDANGAATTGTVNIMHGGAFHCSGGDTSQLRVDFMVTSGCGIAVQNKSLYPATIGNLMSEGGGIAYQYGQVNAAHIGGGLDYGYFESNTLDIVIATIVNDTMHKIGPITNLALYKTFHISGKDTAKPTTIDTTATNNVCIWSNEFQTYMSAKRNLYLSARTVTETNTISFSLDLLIEQYRRLWGWRTMEFFVSGTGASAQPTGNITFTCTAPYTINGGAAGASAVYNTFTAPVRFLATLDAGDINFTIRRIGG